MGAAREFSASLPRKLRACPPFLRAWLTLGIVDLGLRAFGFRRVAARVHAPAYLPVGAGDVRRAHEYARWLRVAAGRHVVRARCLHQALALHHWLRREGLPSELRIGVRMVDGELRAHAWVELAGHVLDEHPAAVAAFTPLASARREPGHRGARATSIVGTEHEVVPVWR